MSESDSNELWHEVAAVMQKPETEWPHVLQHYTKLSSFEKIAENETYLQVVPHTDRMDYLHAMGNNPNAAP